MSENQRIGIRIATIIDVLSEEIASLKPDENDTFNMSDVYNDLYELYNMSNKYCRPLEKSA